jgi:DNA phosphorothioation-dependent restriction protein DptG
VVVFDRGDARVLLDLHAREGIGRAASARGDAQGVDHEV